MNDYVNMALVGFDGQLFHEIRYKGVEYLCVVHEDYVSVFSNETITFQSQVYRDGYKTRLNFGEIEDLEQCQMFATYKGNEYMVQRVSPRLQQLELLVRKGFEKEDLALGFEEHVDGPYEHVFNKLVGCHDIDSIRVEKESIYTHMLNNNP